MLVSENYAFFLEGILLNKKLKTNHNYMCTVNHDFIFSYALALMRDETRPQI